MSRFALSRREVLKGILGGAVISVALPPLDAMFNGNGTALAAGEVMPKRFGIFYWGNGVRPSQWNPSTTGSGWALSEELMPLASIKDYVSVVSGMNIKTGNERGHHAGNVGILSGAPMIPQDPMGAPYASTFSAPTVDQVVAEVIGDQTRFRSIEFGVSDQVVTGEGTTLRYLSHNGPDNANPPEYSPQALFNRLFTDGFVPPGEVAVRDPRVGLRRSILDAVMGDAEALKRRLGTTDQRRLDQHFESVRTLELQLARRDDPDMPQALFEACAVPTMPGMLDRNAIAQRSNQMNQILAMALACDQTRVFSNMFSGSVSYTRYSDAGAASGHHDLTHDEGGDQPTVNRITIFIMEQFAHMLETLKAVPEGDGNLLDNCCILASSDTADGRGHTINDYPILVAGRAGGALKYPSVHYRSQNGENTSMVLLSLLRAMDLPLEEFGVLGGHVTTSLSAIES